ncbi:restriction endonuclease subunit S [Aliarcobacter cryaerophilus]|uniref:Restriction endonuclease subunit S n=1 Tax=Aliarcobacter cryaerophilus TaxID=28198 RepID=A0AA46S312_9BACT|nr:restriction endonuclease subunit S [Aliarcobacter cryaerophilus]UYF44393.1 restriction endonuclease subunit S [Aliarcobacter cryaerophilus]
MNQIKQGYKQTKVGIIPEDWEVVKLGELSNKIGSGITPTGGETVYQSSGRFFIRSQNVGLGSLLLDDVAYISDEIHSTFKNTEIKQNDVLLNITGASIGRCAIANKTIEGGNVNQHVCIIRPKINKIDTKFLTTFLLSHQGQKQIDSFQAGGNRQGLNFAQIASFITPLPPLKEQEKIAQILTTWDEAITKQTELLRAKELQKKALMQKLLSGEVRFNGFNDVWQEIRLDKLVFFQEGPGVRNTQYRKSGVKLLNVGNLNNNILNLSSTETYISEEEAYGVYKHFLVDEGDLLISCSGINSESFKKKIAFVKKEHLPLCMNTSTMRFKNLKNKLLLEYLYFFFQTLFFEKQVFGVLTGSAQFNFGPTHIKWFKIKLPSLPEQQKIAEVLSLADDEINLLKNELEELKLQKKALMQKLLTGEVRVKV